MRYCGGKARIARHLRPEVLRYAAGRPIVEPFCGALSMTLALRPVAISDASEPLVRLIRAVRNGWRPVVMTETRYKEIQAAGDDGSPEYAFAGLCCTWGGKWWGGYARPHPNNPDPQGTTVKTVVSRVSATADIPLTLGLYDTIDLPDGCVVYCDPPYAGSVSGYPTPRFDTPRFWDWCREVCKTRDVVVSEYVAPEDFVSIYERRTNFSLHGGSAYENLFVRRR